MIATITGFGNLGASVIIIEADKADGKPVTLYAEARAYESLEVGGEYDFDIEAGLVISAELLVAPGL